MGLRFRRSIKLFPDTEAATPSKLDTIIFRFETGLAILMAVRRTSPGAAAC